MTPSEVANDALNATLEAVQALMKRSRRVAKDLKLYGGSATSFSPKLLSCAAVVRQHSKAGAFVSLPDWNLVVDNDPRINTHPRFHKTVDYRRSPTSPNAEQEPSSSSSIVPAELHSVTETLEDVIPAGTPEQPAQSKAPHPVQSPYTVSEVQLPALLSPAAPVTEPMVIGYPKHASVTFKEHVAGSITTAQKATPPPDKKQKDNGKRFDCEPTPTPVSWKPLHKRKRKFMSDDEETGASGTIHVKHRALSVKAGNAVARSDRSQTDVVDQRGFWDAETRPAGWGLDSTIATAVESSILFVTIDGAGVRQRLQAKAQAAMTEPSINPRSKCSKTRTPKSHAAVKTPLAFALPKTTKPSTRSTSRAVQTVVVDNSPIGNPSVASFRLSKQSGLQPSAPAILPEPEPTAGDILQSIHDLGRRFNLLATNERMDALDTRVDLVEQRISVRLMALEEHFSISDAHQRSVTQSIGNLSMSFWAHRNNPSAHRHQANGTTYAPQHHPEQTIASWPICNSTGDEHPGISTVGQEYTHAWDQSLTTVFPGNTRASTSGWQFAHAPDPPYMRRDSIASSRLSSASPVESEE
ncbi:uncharacterized protein F5891DRAFT_1194614 [Suillus fuscotomentosus]|uniref:Uncharacterized protein n=1 Tax=Suillus fuscotomentosus TaxID=1912939 RepID=A0AAD4DYR7_9AGAM|nr:uncharacterized protein F5891DRAFT_1194614 [Suillus fuscotomentosus]KAG1895098.1 hypothetical protein F5891DRAFT_1194614 [Suillus fuscotomentosus]